MSALKKIKNEERDKNHFADKRLFDLVRQMRAELHREELITDDEYAILASEDGAVDRLNTYDQMIKRTKRAELEVVRLREEHATKLGALENKIEKLSEEIACLKAEAAKKRT